MRTIEVSIHLILLSIESVVYYMLKLFGKFYLELQYIINQIEYYKELPIVYATLVCTLFFVPIGVIAAIACKNNKLKCSFLLIYLVILAITFYILRYYVTTKINATYGAEYFFYNFYLYVIGLVIFWFVIVEIHLYLAKSVEKLIAKSGQ